MELASDLNGSFGTTVVEAAPAAAGRWLPFAAWIALLASWLPSSRINAARARALVEVEQAHALLGQAVEELNRSNKELEAFAVVRHDLQKPSAALRADALRLRDRCLGRLDEATEQDLVRVVDGAERAERIVHDLLAYSRVGFQSRAFLPVDMDNALSVALQGLEAVIEASGAEIIRGELPMVAADSGQLSLLFTHLIGNAIKFRTAQAPVIRVERREQYGQQIFSITDNGMGMDPRLSPRIFEIFQQLNGEGAYPGTGIGLSICKKVVERHGGRIWVDSLPGEGATFSFTLHESS